MSNKPQLSVRNNWESLEWSFNGERIAAERVSRVMAGGRECGARPARRVRRYNDHGHWHTVETVDIEIEVEVPLVSGALWLSLSQFSELRNAVTAVTEDPVKPLGW